MLSYDDVSHHQWNPFRGKLFNKPDPDGPGHDVYKGCAIDYRASEVTPETFIAVITGNESAVQDKGNGRVLRSTASDNVFIAYFDHGGKGIISFPDGNLLYADTLIQALKQMHGKGMYRKLVFYMEAGESGSMFEGRLPNDIDIYVTTAANDRESSWGTYCGNQAVVNGQLLGVCLGDLYSISWMEDLDQHDASETLQEQYEKVKERTTQSHVMQFGDLTFVNDSISEFLGSKNAQFYKQENGIQYETIPARDVKLHFLYQKFLNTTYHKYANYWSDKLQKEIKERTQTDAFFHTFCELIFGYGHEQMLKMYLPALNLSCLRLANTYYQEKCLYFNDYSLQYVNIFNTVCMTVDLPEDQIIKTIDQLCL